MYLLDPASEWKPVNDYLHKAFDRMKRLSGEIVVFGSGKCTNSIMHDTEGHRKLVEVIRKTGEIAQQYEITVVIEPLNTSETNSINCG